MKLEFVERVMSKVNPFGKYVTLAVERHQNNLKHQGTRDFPWIFSDDAAYKYLNEFPKMSFWAGDRAGEPFILMPHFEFIIASLFGWVHREVGNNRFVKAYTELARGGAKSTLLGGAIAVDMKLGEHKGAEYYSAATTGDQAAFIYDAGINLLETHTDLTKIKNRNPVEYQIGDDPNAVLKFTQYVLERSDTKSKFKAAASKTGSLDGKNARIAGVDEIHEHRTSEVHDSLWTGMKKRRSILLWMITTAGYNFHSIGRQQREYAAKLAKNIIQNERYFSLIFTPDMKADWPDLCALDEYRVLTPKERKKVTPEDDYTDKKIWIKANPGIEYDVPVLDLMEADFSETIAIPQRINAFKTKCLNIWCSQETVWIDISKWDECAAKPKPRTRVAYGAVDLAGILDLTCAFFAVPNAPWVDVYCLSWTNNSWINDKENPYADQFKQWAKEGWVTIQDSLLTDYDEVREDIIKFLELKKLTIQTIGIEAGFEGHEFSKNLNKALYGRDIGHKQAKVVRVGMGQLTSAVNDTEALIKAQRIRHGGNPVLRFCVGNVSMKTGYDGRKRHPVKAGGQNDKIDGAVAMFLGINEMFRTEPRGKYEQK